MALDALRQFERRSRVPHRSHSLQLLMSGVFLRGLIFESQSAAMCNSQAQLAQMPQFALKAPLNHIDMSSISRKNEPTL